MSNYTSIRHFNAYAKAKIAQARLNRAKAEVDAAKAILAELGSGRHVVSDGQGHAVGFTVSENNTYPTEALLDGLKPGQVQRITSRTLDREKYRAVYPDRWEAAKVTNGFKVTL